MIDFGMWFMFPIAVLIATIAMMSGIGGAIMFSSFFLLVLKLQPAFVIGIGLFIEFFGFSSGVFGYWKKNLINFNIIKKLIKFTVTGTILGTVLSIYVPKHSLNIILGILLFYLSYNFLFKDKKCTPKCVKQYTKNNNIKPNINISKNVYSTNLLGGILIGLSSSGLGEINENNFLEKLKLPVSISAGTSVFLISISALIGAVSHTYFLYTEFGFKILKDAISILVFSIPGVIIGGQLGVFLSQKIKVKFMEKFIGTLFLILGISLFAILF